MHFVDLDEVEEILVELVDVSNLLLAILCNDLQPYLQVEPCVQAVSHIAHAECGQCSDGAAPYFTFRWIVLSSIHHRLRNEGQAEVGWVSVELAQRHSSWRAQRGGSHGFACARHVYEF